jgi:enoyl-CoA hydratase/carnithine racemase
MSPGIEIRRDGAVVSAAFDRPEEKNGITSAMYEALIDVFDKAERDPDVGALVLSGAGGVFTAGNDINDFLAVATGAAAGSRDIRDAPGWRFITKLAGFEKPLVAAVQGQAVGIGTTLCFHCDLVYASADARFHMPFVNLGLVPEAGASLRFGRARASEFLLLAEPFDADTARELGLVNAVLPESTLLAARRLMRSDPGPLKARMEEEIAAFSAALASGEARAAFMAFLSGAKG